ncbi:MAG: hypothetical protein JOZ38_01305, partial [Candidatus Eremiobacteraeota bacterium]|nr:hypothetical protein [Candidatus Eremiobacteraeota bacterium]
AARRVSADVRATVLAHAESADVRAFGDASYNDAAGPTVHFPVSAHEFDPWAPRVSETNNRFYRAVDGEAVARAIA